jgi:hypothetical protein
LRGASGGSDIVLFSKSKSGSAIIDMGTGTGDGEEVGQRSEHEERGRAVLNEAIDRASARTERTFLKTLYHMAPEVDQMMDETFLAVEETGGEEADHGNSEEKQQKFKILSPGSGDKRVRPRYVQCEQCKKEFDVTMNSDKACFWHDGSLVIE